MYGALHILSAPPTCNTNSPAPKLVTQLLGGGGHATDDCSCSHPSFLNKDQRPNSNNNDALQHTVHILNDYRY